MENRLPAVFRVEADLAASIRIIWRGVGTLGDAPMDQAGAKQLTVTDESRAER
jgi:hypothetical protein